MFLMPQTTRLSRAYTVVPAVVVALVLLCGGCSSSESSGDDVAETAMDTMSADTADIAADSDIGPDPDTRMDIADSADVADTVMLDSGLEDGDVMLDAGDSVADVALDTFDVIDTSDADTDDPEDTGADSVSDTVPDADVVTPPVALTLSVSLSGVGDVAGLQLLISYPDDAVSSPPTVALLGDFDGATMRLGSDSGSLHLALIAPTPVSSPGEAILLSFTITDAAELGLDDVVVDVTKAVDAVGATVPVTVVLTTAP
ncbi:MAG: hypothetical protein ACI9MR_000980 [Myxococcota bacterium]|jgi:hypothetical protein